MVKYNKDEVLTPFTVHLAKKGMLGYFGNSPYGMDIRIENGKLEELIDSEFSAHPFRGESGDWWMYFLPASYEDSQRHWVIKNNLQVGDKVKITRDWEIGEQGYTDSYHFHIGETFIVNEILHNTIRVYEEDRKGEGWSWNLPYFAIEKVTEEYRHFKDAEEFEPHREKWWTAKTPEGWGKAPFRVTEYSDKGVSFAGSTHSYKVFFEEYINADTGEPAGVKV